MAPNRSDVEKHKDQVRRGNQARYEARNELIRRHPEEYAKIYTVIAAEYGVTAKVKK